MIVHSPQIVQLLPVSMLLLTVSFVSANCNIDSAGVKTYSTTDGLVITKAGITATFTLGCDRSSPEPKLHAEIDGRYAAVVQSLDRPESREVSMIEDLDKSKSRYIEIKIFDDETYQARKDEKNLPPLKTISVSHYGVKTGPYIKTETLTTILLICAFIYAKNKMIS